jgi:hypothetical protein
LVFNIGKAHLKPKQFNNLLKLVFNNKKSLGIELMGNRNNTT